MFTTFLLSFTLCIPDGNYDYSNRYRLSRTESYYCVCELPESYNCSSVCPPDGTIIDFDDSGFADPVSHFDSSKSLHFTLIGTHNHKSGRPRISLEAFSNFNVTITGHTLNRPEYILLQPGEVSALTRWFFSHVHIQLQKGRYDFGYLRTENTEFLPSVATLPTQISQQQLSTDFESFASLPSPITHIGPTHSFELFLNESIRQLSFLSEHTLIAHKGGSSAVFDLLQLPTRKGLAIVNLLSRSISLEFQPLPKSRADLPNITFRIGRSAKVFFNASQFPDHAMDLTDLWRFEHLERSLYFESHDGVTPPTVTTIGSVPAFLNNQTIEHHSRYCLCSRDCGACRDPVFKFRDIDDTVIGNPSRELHYTVVGSNVKRYPKFNLEHFGDRNLTVEGYTGGEYVGVVDAADDQDPGFHVFMGVTVHLAERVKFPAVNFVDVDLLCKQKVCVVNSSLLEIDYKTLSMRDVEAVRIAPPFRGITVNTSGYLNFVNISLITPHLIKINGQSVLSSKWTRPEFVIRADGNVNLVLGSKLRSSANLDLIPRLRLVLNSDSNFLSCGGDQWPSELSDITAKVVIVHGDKPLNVVGQLEGKTYITNPAVIAHDGTGPLSFNGILSNFHEQYCLCEGKHCSETCQEIGDIVSYSERKIHRTIIGNPHRVVHYFVAGSIPEHRPFFGLHDFHNKSFMISSISDRSEYVSLEGIPDFFTFPPSSVSHIFQNVDLELATPGYFPFNNAVFTSVTVSKASPDVEYHVVQRGMSIDFKSLYAFDQNKLMFPCSLYLRILGGIDLKQITLQTTETITLVGYYRGEKAAIPLDLSRLQHPITVSVREAIESDPLVINWEIAESLLQTIVPPQIRIDVSETIGDAAFVTFTGRPWTGLYHNLSERLTIDHGQLNIHIAGVAGRQPPHVRLEGVGDYYINGMKQVSAMAQGHHADSVLDEDSVWPGILVPIIACAGIIGGLVVLCYLPRAVPPDKIPLVKANSRREDGPQFLPVEADMPEVEV